MAGQYGEISGAEAFSNPKTSPVYAWKDWANYFYPVANNQRYFYKRGGEASQLYNQFKSNYLGGSADAAANAKIYQDYAKHLFANQPNQNDLYQQTGDYLYGKFNDFAQNSANAGNRAMNERAAALGYGGQGANSYLAKINADRITSNLAPAFSNTTNAIGRDYQAQQSNDYAQMMTRLGLAQGDALNGYMDRVYSRPMDVYNARAGQLNDQNQQYGALMNNYLKNVAGYQTKETNDIAKYGRVFDRWASSYGGGSSAPYQQGPNQTMQPANNYQPQNYNTQQGNNYNPYLDNINAPYNGQTGLDYGAGNTGYLGDVNAGSSYGAA